MNELLDIAIKAHGGLERWSKVNAVKTSQTYLKFSGMSPFPAV